jgi:hypothetical protein
VKIGNRVRLVAAPQWDAGVVIAKHSCMVKVQWRGGLSRWHDVEELELAEQIHELQTERKTR